ncbi:MAG: hypothetical protein KR126chlam1_00828 [Chlamydiae bacterium]|nr:hypothetical protein [Chlamydiota bacterium]
MFGLEKKEPKEPFQFDLEVDLKADPKMADAMLKSVQERLGKLKDLLRQGAENEDFDEYGVLLHGYAALEKVLKKVMKKQ